jgi:hypothetical protein
MEDTQATSVVPEIQFVALEAAYDGSPTQHGAEPERPSTPQTPQRSKLQEIRARVNARMALRNILNSPVTPARVQRWEDVTEISDSQGDSDAELTPPPPSAAEQTRKQKSPELTRDQRIMIRTALEFGHSYKEIRDKLNVSFHQISYARYQPLTPKADRRHKGKPKIKTPKRMQLEAWLQASPSRKRLRYNEIPYYLPPEWGLNGVGEKAVRTAFTMLSYHRGFKKKRIFGRSGCHKSETTVC